MGATSPAEDVSLLPNAGLGRVSVCVAAVGDRILYQAHRLAGFCGVVDLDDRDLWRSDLRSAAPSFSTTTRKQRRSMPSRFLELLASSQLLL